jgi:hypothetical protein
VGGLAHRPGAKQGALFGAGAVDVGGAEARVTGPEGEPAGARVLGLGAGDRARDVGGMTMAGRPMEELRGGAQLR